MSDDLKAYNTSDLRAIAKKRIPKGLFEFVDRGTEDEVALRNNRSVFDPRLRPPSHRPALRAIGDAKAVAKA